MLNGKRVREPASAVPTCAAHASAVALGATDGQNWRNSVRHEGCSNSARCPSSRAKRYPWSSPPWPSQLLSGPALTIRGPSDPRAWLALEPCRGLAARRAMAAASTPDSKVLPDHSRAPRSPTKASSTFAGIARSQRAAPSPSPSSSRRSRGKPATAARHGRSAPRAAVVVGGRSRCRAPGRRLRRGRVTGVPDRTAG